MGSISDSFSSLFETKRTTHTYKLGDKTLDLTPTGFTPAELLKKLYENGAELIIVGDNSHHEPSVDAGINSLLGDKSLKITKFAVERTGEYKPLYDDFLKGNDRGLKSRINNPNDYYAPKESEYPELRKKFFAERLKTFETTRDNGIKVGFVDHNDRPSIEAADDAHNKLVAFRRDFIIAKSLRDDQGKPLDIERFAKPELDKVKEKIIRGLRMQRIGTDSDRAIMNTDAYTFVDISKDLFRDIKLNYNAAHTAETVQKAGQIRFDTLDQAKEAAEQKRDDIRNQQMAKNISSLMQEASTTGQRVVFMIGADHLGKQKKDAKVPSLEELLKSKLGNKVVRVDIVPVSKEEAKKLGVTIGGMNEANYTIFVPSDGIHTYLFKDTGVSKPAKDGPHKDQLKSLKISQAEIVPQFAITHDTEYLPCSNGFTSGLSTALPKGFSTKTV